MRNRFVDIHHHIIFGFDDGAASEAVSRQMLTAASQDGIRYLFATSHAKPHRMPYQREDYELKLLRLNEICREDGLELMVLPGAEVFYSEPALRRLANGELPSLAFTRYTLVEFYPGVSFEEMLAAVRSLFREQYIPILAHVERYACLYGHPERLEALKDQGNLLLQMNCETILGKSGKRAEKFCRQALEEGWIDFAATDAHDIDHRAARMGECYERLTADYGSDYADMLCFQNQWNTILRDFSAELLRYMSVRQRWDERACEASGNPGGGGER